MMTLDINGMTDTMRAFIVKAYASFISLKS